MRALDRTPRLTLPRVAVAAAGTCLAFAVQALAWRLGGTFPPRSLLASSLLVLAAVHGGLFLLLAGRRGERPWMLALLLLPAALGTWPAAARWGPLGALGAVAAAALLAAVGSLLVRAPGRPLLAAVLGTALGSLTTAVFFHFQLEAGRLPRGGFESFALWACTGLALLMLIGADRWLPARLLPLFQTVPRPGAAVLLALVALSAGWAAGRFGAPPLLPASAPRPGTVGAGAEEAPPVVLVVLDTVRADHLRAYGASRDTMPRLERFAREHGVRFDRAISTAPSSLEAHGSMFTGLLALRHGARKPSADDPTPPAYAYPLLPGVVTLAQLLRRAGYWPVALSANFGPLAPDFGLSRGFAIYKAVPGTHATLARRDPLRFAMDRRWPLAGLDRVEPLGASEFFELGVPYRRASVVVDEAFAALDRAGDRPFFLFLNLLEAHYPYRPPRVFDDVFPGTRRPGLAPLADDTGAVAEIMAGRRPPTAAEHRAWSAAYDSELRYLDRELGRLLDRLERHPRFADMLVIITSDHGEGFGEHGVYRHSTVLYDEILRVPLFIKPGRRHPPAVVPGAVLPGPIQPTDLFPTVLAHAGLAIPRPIDGTAWGEGRTVSFAESHIHLAAKTLSRRFWSERWVAQEGDWKLILASDGTAELFDVAADPGERTNRAAEAPVRVRALRQKLTAAGLGVGLAARRPGGGSGEIERSLRSLGYVQ